MKESKKVWYTGDEDINGDIFSLDKKWYNSSNQFPIESLTQLIEKLGFDSKGTYRITIAQHKDCRVPHLGGTKVVRFNCETQEVTRKGEDLQVTKPFELIEVLGGWNVYAHSLTIREV